MLITLTTAVSTRATSACANGPRGNDKELCAVASIQKGTIKTSLEFLFKIFINIEHFWNFQNSKISRKLKGQKKSFHIYNTNFRIFLTFKILEKFSKDSKISFQKTFSKTSWSSNFERKRQNNQTIQIHVPREQGRQRQAVLWQQNLRYWHSHLLW